MTAEELKEAREAAEKELQLRIQEIRALYAKVQEASKSPPSIDRKNAKARAPWYRLRAWVLETGPAQGLRKVVVKSRHASSDVERC